MVPSVLVVPIQGRHDFEYDDRDFGFVGHDMDVTQVWFRGIKFGWCFKRLQLWIEACIGSIAAVCAQAIVEDSRTSSAIGKLCQCVSFFASCAE